MTNQKNNDPIDPRLEAMLALLRPTPRRNSAAAEMGKARFISEVDALSANESTQSNPRTISLKEKLIMLKMNLTQRSILTTLVVAVTLLVVLFGGAGMTAFAAQSALPGDALYQVKTGLEDTRTNLTANSARQVELQLAFAERRLDEIENLIAEGRFDDIAIATQQFQMDIQRALGSLKELALSDSVSASGLAAEITAALTRYAAALAEMNSRVPAQVQVELQKALQFSQSGDEMQVQPDGEIEFSGVIEQLGPDSLVVNGQQIRLTAQTEIKSQLQLGMQIKVHAMRGADGLLVAREIEADQFMGGDDNSNGNLNGNDNSNGNVNDDDNSNGNVNDDDNSNGNDDDGNSNDDSGNANDDNDNANDDDGNSNDDNGNANDDNGNANDDNGNSNDDSGNANDENGNDDNSNDDNGNDDNGYGLSRFILA